MGERAASIMMAGVTRDSDRILDLDTQIGLKSGDVSDLRQKFPPNGCSPKN